MIELLEEQYFRVMELEEQLKIERENLRTMIERDVPDYMESKGIGEAFTPSGMRVVLGDEVHVNMPAVKERQQMVEWCAANKLPGLIKTTVTVHFGAKTYAYVKPLIESFRTVLGQTVPGKFELEVDTTIHGSTLKAFVTKALRKGQPLPEMFGYYAPRAAIITLPTPPAAEEDLTPQLVASLAEGK